MGVSIKFQDEVSAAHLVCVCAQSLSRVQLFVTPWTVACQDPLTVGILQARTLEWVASSQGSVVEEESDPSGRNPSFKSLLLGG